MRVRPRFLITFTEFLFCTGGVSKEFFQLVVKSIFDPSYGMWTEIEETRRMWFNLASTDNPVEFSLIGTVCIERSLLQTVLLTTYNLLKILGLCDIQWSNIACEIP